MADATPTAATPDTIATIDVAVIQIAPLQNSVFYRLRQTWSSGRVDYTERNVSVADFNACLASFCQATPKKKFLSWLVSSGYETNITPS